MRVSELITELREADIKLWIEEDNRLHFKSPASGFPIELRQKVQAQKAEVLQFLREAKKESQQHGTIPQVERNTRLALSFAEERQWFIDQLEPDTPIYNIHRTHLLEGELNRIALERSLESLVLRHEILRTHYRKTEHEHLVRVINSRISFKLTVTDLSNFPEPEKSKAIQQRSKIEATRRFNLEKGPLFRLKLLRLAQNRHVLLFTVHHIIIDDWSIGILWRELNQLYISFRDDKASTLPELSIQYADFSAWQRSDDFLPFDQLDYWKSQLRDAPALISLPTDHPRPPRPSYRGGNVEFIISRDLTKKIKQLAQRQETTLFMMLLAAFKVLLFRYSDDNQIVVGTPIANRNKKEIEGIIGFFVNTLVLNDIVSKDASFVDTLAQIRQTALHAYEHQDLPFEKLVEELQPERSLSYHPLFQVMFVLQNAHQDSFSLQGLKVSTLPANNPSAKFDLTLFVDEFNGELHANFTYSRDLFEQDSITRMAGHFENLLKNIVADPSRNIVDIPILTEEEKHQLLFDWNDTHSVYPQDLRIQQIFERQADRMPETPGIIFGNKPLTYREINRGANQIAKVLIESGAKHGDRIGISVERSAEMVMGLLGILKAGGAYVPVDADDPEERLAFLLSDSDAQALLTQEKARGKFAFWHREVYEIESVLSKTDADLINPQVNIPAQDTACIMYTSGSTGNPKGIIVKHQGIVRLVKQCNYAHLSSEETLLQLAPLSFDASTFEIWGALLNGARLVVMPPGTPSLSELASTIRDQEVSTLWLTAGLFHVMVEEQIDTLRRVPQLLAGGDVLSVPHVKKLLGNYSGVFINGYGPTENTTFTTCYRMDQTTRIDTSVPIGRPISNTQVYILDERMNPVPVGVPGTLFTGGDGLAAGYLNQPELTAANFLSSPFQSGKRLYDTGDVAKYLPDGNIEFLGRRDTQIKVRGFRIEPGEVEFTLCSHPKINDATLVVHANGTQKSLVVYFIAEDKPEPAGLKQFLSEKLPSNLIPDSFVQLASLPLTANGKIDREALPPPTEGNWQPQAQFVAPRNAYEQKLAQIWEATLQHQPIGVHNNFFDLGGHSLLAISLFEKIRKATGQQLPLTTLFQAPTIAEQAEALRKSTTSSNWLSLTPIQTNGTKPRLFLVPPAGGTGLGFRRLAHFLGKDQPLYTFQPAGADGTAPPHHLTEDMATYYIKAMTALQPEGSYRIGGMCFGGVVAWEMAKQLKQQGQSTECVLLLDSVPPAHGAEARRSSSYYIQQIAYHARLGLLHSALYNVLIRPKIIALKEFIQNPHNPFPRLLTIHQRAQMRYLGTVSSVTTLLVQSEENVAKDHSKRWQSLARGRFDHFFIPASSHRSLLLENDQHTQRMAELIQTYLASLDDPTGDNKP